MSLFKRGNVWWVYLWQDGVRHQYSTGTSNRRQAEKVEDKLKTDLNNRRFQIVELDPDITFGAIAAKFLASGSARPHHRYHLAFLLSFYSDIPALRITKALADEFRKARRAANPAIKDATVNRDLSVLRHILYWAVDEQILAQNPLARLKMAPERRIRRQILSLAEEDKLLAAAKAHIHTMILIALDTGMRRGEITSQRWEDVDFSQKIISVTHSKTPGGESREIPLTERLSALLMEHPKPAGLIIEFNRQAVRIVKRTWKTALKNAGIRHVRFHDLRHTFNTRCMEAGVLQEVRMALMGHSTGSKIHSVYTHIELPTKREAIRRLEAWIKSQREQLKENHHADSKINRSEIADACEVGAQTVEEKVPRRGGLGTSRQAENRDRRDGEGSGGQAPATSEIRRGKKAL